MSKLPDDPKALKAIIMRLEGERDDLHTTNLRLQVELDRLKKRYYGPRADRLETMTDLAQMLLSFAEELDNKPVHPEDAALVLHWSNHNNQLSSSAMSERARDVAIWPSSKTCRPPPLCTS